MLRLCDIVKNYPTATTTVQALRGVSLAFREAEFVAILGPSGCGKTTMLNIIGGLDRYTSGDLVIGGVSTAAFDDLHWDAYRNATIGFVFQSYNLIPHLTVMENVELALSLVGEKKKSRRAKVVAALHRVGMGDEINKRPNQLSGGQMQRVAIARAIVNDPKIILADEPTGALDSELSTQVMDILKEISKTRLVIMVTHNSELAYQYCSRICRFKDGSLIEDTNPYDPEEEALESGFDVLGMRKNEYSSEDGDLSDADETEKSGQNVPADGASQIFEDSVTTDTLSLQNEGQNPENGRKPSALDGADADGIDHSKLFEQEDALLAGIADGEHSDASEDSANSEEGAPVPTVSQEADDIDYSGLFNRRAPINVKLKKVSNRKRKKQMKRNRSSADPVLNRLGINSLNKRKRKQKKQMKKEKTFKPTSMSAGMAFGLSLRNLIAKRNRTFFTAFAGSIGIIGLGLVLAISNGFNVFVDNMQTEMLAGVPVGVYEYNVQVSVLDNIIASMSKIETDENAFPEGNNVGINKDSSSDSSLGAIMDIMDTFFQSVSRNELSEEFCKYMMSYNKDYGAMNIFYGTRFNLISRYYDLDSKTVKYIDASQSPADISAMTIAMTILGDNGIQPKYWQQLVGDEKHMTSQYDVLAGSYPKNSNELALCVNEYNQINSALLDAFGIKLIKYDTENYTAEELSPEEITFDTFIGKRLRLVFNNDYYERVTDPDANGNYLFKLPGEKKGDEFRWGYTDQTKLKELYDNENGIDLTITGVIRPKKDTQAAYVSTGSICYTPELGALVAKNAYDSEIAKLQRKITANESDKSDAKRSTVFKGYALEDKDIASTSIMAVMENKLAFTTYEESIGATMKPSYIAVYPQTYQQKIDICDYINDWNDTHKTVDGKASIGYFDVSEMVVHSLNMIINLVSMLLIAVASISLVVSTVMIGVITSNSVIERTREIGILRALGARKRDIRNVFVAETSLIGLAAGLLGIIITYILSPIISLIIGALSGVPNLLHFHPLHALLLVLLSLLLTVLSGIIPAIGASRKNVVDALRVE